MADRSKDKRSELTADRGMPGAFEGETVSRRRLFTRGALVTGGIAGAAIGLPALGFALGPAFVQQEPTRWQDIGAVGDFNPESYVTAVITLVPDAGEAGKTTIYVRRRNVQIDTEPGDRWNQYIAL